MTPHSAALSLRAARIRQAILSGTCKLNHFFDLLPHQTSSLLSLLSLLHLFDEEPHIFLVFILRSHVGLNHDVTQKRQRSKLCFLGCVRVFISDDWLETVVQPQDDCPPEIGPNHVGRPQVNGLRSEKVHS